MTDRVLFTDGEAILLDKPAGLPVDRPRDRSFSLEDALETLTFGFRRPPTIVHRLDQDTSGVLLLARNAKAHARFAATFEAGRVAKTYLAVLDGVPAGAAGRIDLPLAKVSSQAQGWRIVPDPRGRPARTAWRLLGVADGRALVEFAPETGRTHQLRVHALAGLGAPIMGDPVYGRAGAAMRLHAWRIEVPREGKPAVAGEAPVPAAFDPWRHLIGGQDRGTRGAARLRGS